LISEEVQHWVNMYFYLLKVGVAEKCTNLWLSLILLHNRASQKQPPSSLAKSMTWKVPIAVQFLIF